MKRLCLLAVAALLTVTAASAAPPTHPLPSFVGLAIADKNRPEEDRALDAQRKPVEVLRFSGIKPGDIVVDLMPGKGYYTRLFSRMVGNLPTAPAARRPWSAGRSPARRAGRGAADRCVERRLHRRRL